MLVWTISRRSTVKVDDFATLLGVWRHYRAYPACDLIGRFVCKEALTDAQLRGLPKALKFRLSYGPTHQLVVGQRMEGPATCINSEA